MLLAQGAPVRAAELLPRVVLEDPYGARTTDWSFGGAYWRPTADEIAEAESKLAAYLAVAPNPDAHDIPSKLDKYGRQYFGAARDGRRVLVIHAFCDTFGADDLTKSLVMVDDGGDCFFEAYYDMDGHHFAGLSVNGYA